MVPAEYPEVVLKHSPWSVSKANLLKLCAKQYLHKYVEKAPEGRKSDSSRVGVVVHALIEQALKIPGVDLYATLRDLATVHELSREELTACSAKITSIQDFIDRMTKFKAANGVTEEYIEHQLAISDNHGPHPFKEVKDADGKILSKPLLRGVIDHAMRTSDDFLIVLDHKSGKKKPIAEHSIQFYAYMALSVANFPWVQGIQSGIHYVGEPKVDWFPRFDSKQGAWTRTEITNIVFPWLLQFLGRTQQRLTTVESGAPSPELGWQCSYCGYLAQCEAGKAEADRRAKKKDPNI